MSFVPVTTAIGTELSQGGFFAQDARTMPRALFSGTHWDQWVLLPKEGDLWPDL